MQQPGFCTSTSIVQHSASTKIRMQPVHGSSTVHPPNGGQGVLHGHTSVGLTISQAGLNKAAGEDDIPYELVKNLGRKAREMLLHIYNLVWAGEPIPANWRTAVIKTLLKEGKDPKITSSYRPISLTACLGKLMEKIVADRLTYVLENRGLLADSQAGFRQNRCTTDQVLRMTQLATDQFQGKHQSSATVITFFDYEKAYDKVWRAGLIHKMQAMDLPDKFIQYTRSAL